MLVLEMLLFCKTCERLQYIVSQNFHIATQYLKII